MTKKNSLKIDTDLVFNILLETFPDARCELEFSTPFELLIATILSAQCTDERVNIVTASLFANANTPEGIISLGQQELENKIRSLGLFHNKAKNIFETSKILLKNFGGQVPKDVDLLRQLPGVGRKTANVVVSNAYGIPALAVDTHVFRVARRLGIAEGKTPQRVEEELKQIFPSEKWTLVHHLLIFQGRRICYARKPNCEECPLKGICAEIRNVE
ncbi:MAG: endonuclease III [Bacillota bacterium]|nr:endonuclease III [Bacillota bacterium]